LIALPCLLNVNCIFSAIVGAIITPALGLARDRPDLHRFKISGLSLVTLRANEVRNLDFRRETLRVAKTARNDIGAKVLNLLR
jgi:hypothetical protein